MGGRHEARRFPNLRNAAVRLGQQFLCFRAAHKMMITQRRHARVFLEGAQQIAAVHKQRFGHGLQGKPFRKVRFDIAASGLR